MIDFWSSILQIISLYGLQKTKIETDFSKNRVLFQNDYGIFTEIGDFVIKNRVHFQSTFFLVRALL